MYCPACGNEIPLNGQFCSVCGMEIITIPLSKNISTPQSVSPHPKTKIKPIQTSQNFSKNKISAAVIIVIIIASGVGMYFAAMAVTWSDVSGSEIYSYTAVGDLQSEIELTLDIDTANVNINYNSSDMDETVLINLFYDISGGFLENKILGDIYEISWNNQLFSMDLKWYMSYITRDDSFVNVTLRTDIKYRFNANIETGTVNVVIPNDIDLSLLSIVTSTGNINIKAEDNLNVSGSLFLESSTGSIQLSTKESATFKDFTLKTSTGYVDAKIGKYANFTNLLYLKSSTGSISLNNSNSDFSNVITLDTSTGNIYFDLMNPHYDNPYNMSSWNLNTNTGDIIFNLVQNSPLDAVINTYLDTGTGDIYIDYSGKDVFASARFQSDDPDDTEIISMTGFYEEYSDIWKSTGYDTSSYKFNFNMDINTGDIELILENQ